VVYDQYGLPREGAIPGTRIYSRHEGFKTDQEIHFFAPPCDDIEIFNMSLPDVFFERFHNQSIREPMTVGGEILLPLDPVIGASYDATINSPLHALLRGLGVIQVEPYTREVSFDDRYREILERKLNGTYDEEILYAVVFVEIPDWYFDVCMRLHPDPSTRSSQEVERDVHSMFSGSSIV